MKKITFIKIGGLYISYIEEIAPEADSFLPILNNIKNFLNILNFPSRINSHYSTVKISIRSI